MIFTKTPPTTPGFYAWRQNGISGCVTIHKEGDVFVTSGHTALLGEWDEHTGWCPLVPAEEIKKAWDEASAIYRPSDIIPLWNKSRAKRVMEGKA